MRDYEEQWCINSPAEEVYHQEGGGGGGGGEGLTIEVVAKYKTPSKTQHPKDAKETAVVVERSVLTASASSRHEPKELQPNILFQEVATTGTWGAVTKRDKYCALTLILLAVGAIAAGSILFVVSNNRNGEIRRSGGEGAGRNGNNSSSSSPPGTSAQGGDDTPVPRPDIMTLKEDRLDYLFTVLRSNQFTFYSTIELLEPSTEVYHLKSLKTTGTAFIPSQVLAMNWILNDDAYTNHNALDDWLVTRYALAVLFFELQDWGYGSDDGGGATSPASAGATSKWINTTNWLDPKVPTCQWHGIRCNRGQTRLMELDLSSNNLHGQIPLEINLLQDLYSLVLTNNRLTGAVPQLAVGSLPRLTILFLNENELEGQITGDIRANGVLDTLMIQLNNFSGVWPNAFLCDVLENFSLDCDKILHCLCCSCNTVMAPCDPYEYQQICY